MRKRQRERDGEERVDEQREEGCLGQRPEDQVCDLRICRRMSGCAMQELS